MQVTFTIKGETHGFSFFEDATLYQRPNGELVAIPSGVFLTAAELSGKAFPDIAMVRPDKHDGELKSPTEKRLDDLQHQIDVLSEVVYRVEGK